MQFCKFHPLHITYLFPSLGCYIYFSLKHFNKIIEHDSYLYAVTTWKKKQLTVQRYEWKHWRVHLVQKLQHCLMFIELSLKSCGPLLTLHLQNDPSLLRTLWQAPSWSFCMPRHIINLQLHSNTLFNSPKWTSWWYSNTALQTHWLLAYS